MDEATTSGRARRGSALWIVLAVSTALAALCAVILQLTGSFTRRQLAEEHDTRAFYIAEAGLSEAYHALTCGGTGRIGSMEEPARYGDGLLWVDATELGERRIQLDSTGLSGMGRAALTLIVERIALPPGVFVDGDFTGEGDFLIDGYDSRVGPYASQVVDPSLLGSLTEIVGATVETVTATVETVLEPVTGSGGLLGGGLLGDAGAGRRGGGPAPVLAPVLAPVYSGAPLTPTGSADVHTAGGGSLGSNGDIRLQGPIRVWGDALPAPGGALEIGGGAVVSGVEQPRAELLELEPVLVPEIELGAPIDHAEALPLVVAPGEAGHASLRVRAGAQAIVRGPLVLRLGSLSVEPGGALVLDDLDGRLDVYVDGAVDFAPGAQVEVTATDPSRLTLQVAGGADVRLAADSQFHGVVYAPAAAVAVQPPFELYGMLVAGRLAIGDGARLHCDTGLDGEAGPLALPRLLSWSVAPVPDAVRARNADPAQVLGVDASTLPAPRDAMETYSWTVRATYVDSGGATVDYIGPFEAFDAGSVGTYASFVLEPPTVATPTPWTLQLSYLDASATPRTYSGPVEGFDPTGLQQILAIVLSPPTLLELLGLSAIAKIFL